MYFYDKYATRIALKGELANDGTLRLHESGPPPARFELRLVDDRLAGDWKQEGSAAQKIDLY